MKNLLTILILVLLFSCTNRNSNPADNYTNAIPVDSIVVYGNIHLVGEEIMPTNDLILFKQDIISTQHWIYETVKEDIILLEGFPLDSEITWESYKHSYEYAVGKEVNSLSIDSLKKLAADYDVQLLFILEGKKKIFGSEYQELYDIVSEAIMKNPNFNLSPELLDARSMSMARNAEEVSMFYGKKVAIIVGDNHLDWFEKNGYTVYHPPVIK